MDDLTGLRGDARIIARAKKRFIYCEAYEAQFREREVHDLKFAYGDPDNNWQWDDALRTARQDRNKPSLTINKVRQHNLQVVNDAKQNKPGVNVRPVGDGATYESAQVFEGVVRHIEYISNAEVAYDTATTFQVASGIGYWRVFHDYVSNESWDQEIYIGRIKNPDSVYLDPDITEFDGSDARFGFVFEDVPRDEFERMYPRDKDVGSSSVIGSVNDNWISSEHVRVAEYYEKDQNRDTLAAFIDPNTGAQIISRVSAMDEATKALYDALKEAGPDLVSERSVLTDAVKWYKIAGDKIIDRRDVVGCYIPIVRVVGEETIIQGKMDRKGHTRYMKDAQRQYNYWPLSLDTPLPTPTGWTTMGSVRVGDMVLDVDGNPTRVKGMSDVFHDRVCYRVKFDDGSEIIADAAHPWVVEERGARQSRTWDWQVKKLTTAELVPGKHFIQTHAPLELPEADLPVDPYVLGAWLGDGNSRHGALTAGPADAPAMALELANAGADVGAPVAEATAMRIPVYRIVGELRKLGVLNNKHIPSVYLRASAAQRLALLQGLMDTDGGINKVTRQCSFDNSNPALMAGMIELLHTMGIKAFKRPIAAKRRPFPSGREYDCRASERVTFTTDQPVFRLGRKAAIQNQARVFHARRIKRFAIRSVTEVDSVPVRCVSIESPSHLFLAGPSMVPTHNTSEATAQVALQTKTPWVVPAEGIENLEEYWNRANVDNSSVLPYNALTEGGQVLPAPQRIQPATMASAYVQGMQITQNEMMMASGQFQSQFGQNENATSGKAINERQRQGDNATYHFIDNLGVAIRYTGKILIEWIPKIYDTARVVKIMAKDGTKTDVMIDPQMRGAYAEQDTEEEGRVAAIFNPNVGRYEVQADVGPGYATRRQEAFNAMTQIASQNKEFMNIGGDLLWKVADFPLADQLAERWQRVIPPNIKGDGPPPEVEQLQQQLEQAGQMVQQLQQQLADQAVDKSVKVQDSNIKGFDAETRRLVAIGNSGPYVTQDQVQPLILQTLIQMLQGGMPNDFGGGSQGGAIAAPQPQMGGAPQQMGTQPLPQGMMEGLPQ